MRRPLLAVATLTAAVSGALGGVAGSAPESVEGAATADRLAERVGRGPLGLLPGEVQCGPFDPWHRIAETVDDGGVPVNAYICFESDGRLGLLPGEVECSPFDPWHRVASLPNQFGVLADVYVCFESVL